MEQLLKPAEGAEKAADKAPQENAEKYQDAGHIVGKAELGTPDDRLKRPDRTGTRSRGTGITVETGRTGEFSLALIDAPLQKVRQMNVGEQGGRRLYPFSIQCRHTPDRVVSPYSARYLPPRARHRSLSLRPKRAIKPLAASFSLRASPQFLLSFVPMLA